MAEIPSEIVKEFVISGHFNLERVKEMLAEYPELLTAKFHWGDNDYEDALGASAHVGNREIAEYLLEQGAPLTITAAAMLGRRDDVERILKEMPDVIFSSGAHNIPLLVHSAFSGDLGIMKLLYDKGAVTGISMAMLHAAARGHDDMISWLVDKGADIHIQNYEGKSALELAKARGNEKTVRVLKSHGA